MKKSILQFNLTPQRLWWYFVRLGRIVLLVILLLTLTSESLPPEQAFDLHLGALTAEKRFDWLGWETGALAEEAAWWLHGRHRLVKDASANSGGLTSRETLQKAEVLAFIERQHQIATLEDRIRGEYAQLPQGGPAALGAQSIPLPPALQALEAELEVLYQEQQSAARRAERILADQVGQILIAEGFGRRGRVWPPVTFRFNDMPTYLIVSPRDEIYQYRGVYLLPDMPEGDRVRLEAQIEADLNVSALIENVGGIGSWPTMIADPISLPSLLDTIAHEWAHNYLVFYPLGQHYSDSPDLTTMNETVASLAGFEIAELVMARFYPEFLPPSETTTPEVITQSQIEEKPALPQEETFDQAMRRIRLRVDALLAEKKVVEAEAYMEAERQKLVDQGHYLRKLNQAFFAFHGSYATSPASVDPIGPWLRQLRAHHETLKGFVDQVAQMSNLDDLLQVLEE